MHASERLNTIMQKVKECSEELETAKDSLREITSKFNDIQKKRTQLFEVFMNTSNYDCQLRPLILSKF